MSILSWADISPLLREGGYVVPDFVASGAVFDAAGGVSMVGSGARVFELASVTKLISLWAILVGVSQGAFTLDSPVDSVRFEGRAVTLRHLLSHSSGLPFEGDGIAVAPESRRVYSNVGIERAAEFAARQVGVPFERWVSQVVLGPLGMVHTDFYGSPAFGCRSTSADLVLLGRELLVPTLVSELVAQESRRVHFPELAGIVPGYGRFSPSPWGLGCQVRGAQVHWLSEFQSEQTFGHFGQSGSYVWVDPVAQVGAVFVGDRPFGAWHKDNWVKLNGAIGRLVA